MRLYVARLNYDATVDDIRALFSPFGEVSNVLVPPNCSHPWQANRGYAFVDMPDPLAARRAIAGLRGQVGEAGKSLQVEEALGRSGGR